MNHTSFVIGRFQPFHIGHKALIQKALSVSKRVVVFIGSSSEGRTEKNPFYPSERVSMILASFDSREQKRLIFSLLPDYPNQNDLWLNHITESLNLINQGQDTYTFVCCDKDKDTAYNNSLVSSLPTIDTYTFHSQHKADSTEIRKLLKENKFLCEIPNLLQETYPLLGKYRNNVDWYN